MIWEYAVKNAAAEWSEERDKCLPFNFYKAALMFLAKERSDQSEEMKAKQVRRFFLVSFPPRQRRQSVATRKVLYISGF